MGLITKAKSAPRSDSGSGGGVKYICNVCSSDITSTVRIRCASKECSDYDLCVTCFSKGEQNVHHKAAEHPYQVIEPHSIPIFDEDWGADEELLLLEGAEQYGLGSFADIADHIGGFREKDEVRDHYIKTYVDSPNFPLPERASPADTRLSTAIPREEFQQRKKRRIEERKQQIAEHSATAPTPAKPTSSIPSCHEVAGFMPGRLEFENEYFNEAEEAVQHMQFSPEEGINPTTGQFDPETELKMVVMTIYNDRLTARTDRKRVILGHKLEEYRKNMAIEKKKSKEQKDLYQKLKPFARLMSHNDFVEFSQDLETEQDLRLAIAQLQEWRRMRIPTLKLGAKYEEEKKTRLARTMSQPGQFDRMASSIRPSKPQANQGIPEIGENVVKYTTKQDLPVRLAADNGFRPPDHNTSPKPPKQLGTNPIPGITSANWDEDSAPDWQLLTPGEHDLCNMLRMHPKAYIVIKNEILREAQKAEGKLKKKHVREICKLDTTRGGRIFEFLCGEGWIANAAK